MSQINPKSQQGSKGDGAFSVSGELVFATAPELLANGRTMFDSPAQAIEIDLQGVTRADSAGLALLIQWLSAGRGRGKDVTFTHVPSQLVAIAKVSGVDALLNLKS